MTTTPPPPGGAPPSPAAQPARTEPGFSWNEFFGFRYMITPILIQAIYLIGAALILIAAIAALFTSGVAGFFIGLIILVFGELAWRVYMELVILLFKMFGSLQEIERRGRM